MAFKNPLELAQELTQNEIELTPNAIHKLMGELKYNKIQKIGNSYQNADGKNLAQYRPKYSGDYSLTKSPKDSLIGEYIDVNLTPGGLAYKNSNKILEYLKSKGYNANQKGATLRISKK